MVAAARNRGNRVALFWGLRIAVGVDHVEAVHLLDGGAVVRSTALWVSPLLCRISDS
jgi:hypothetical protein